VGVDGTVQKAREEGGWRGAEVVRARACDEQRRVGHVIMDSSPRDIRGGSLLAYETGSSRLTCEVK